MAIRIVADDHEHGRSALSSAMRAEGWQVCSSVADARPQLKRPLNSSRSCRAQSRPDGLFGISHTWLQRLARRFEADPSEMQRIAG